MSTFLKNFWEKHGSLVLIILAISLFFVVAFKIGQLEKESEGAAKINITLAEKKEVAPVDLRAKVIEEALERKNIENNIDATENSEATSGVIDDKECAFAASKNSTKYHLPNCSNAIRIKDSNKICFSSEEEAQAKGYERAKCCFK